MRNSVPERVLIEDPRHIDSFYDENIIRYRFAREYVDGQKVIDMACGTGYGSNMMGVEGNACHVLGMDISPDALDVARQLTIPGKVEFTFANAEQLPAATGEWDVVVSLETIEHLANPHRYLQELRRVLRVGGQVIISTPLNNTNKRFQPDNPFHLREYSSTEFAALLSNFFSEIEIWSQTTEYQDDLYPVAFESSGMVSSLRRGLRAVVPEKLRCVIRRSLRSEGLHPIRSYIQKGVIENACVQIAVCR